MCVCVCVCVCISYICKLEFIHVCVPVSVCILHLWPRSNIHNADIVLSLVIMLRAPRVACSLVCFQHPPGSSAACSHSSSFSSLLRKCGAFLSGAGSARVIPRWLAGVKVRERCCTERRTWCPLVEEDEQYEARRCLIIPATSAVYSSVQGF